MYAQPLHQITPHPTDFLWPHRLALGKVALLDGDPNLGKSFVTLDLCARLSTGRPFPDGSPSPGVCTSLVLNGEDGTDTTVPRLHTLGADLTRIFVPNHDDHGSPQCLSAESAILDAALRQTHACLVVIDPITAFLDPDSSGVDRLVVGERSDDSESSGG